MPQASVGELQALAEEKLTALSGQLDQAQRAVDDATKELAAVTASKTTVQAQVDALAERLATQQAELTSLEGKLSGANAAVMQRLQDQEAQTAKRIEESDKKLDQIGKERGEVLALRDQARAILDDARDALTKSQADLGARVASVLNDLQGLHALVTGG